MQKLHPSDTFPNMVSNSLGRDRAEWAKQGLPRKRRGGLPPTEKQQAHARRAKQKAAKQARKEARRS